MRKILAVNRVRVNLSYITHKDYMNEIPLLPDVPDYFNRDLIARNMTAMMVNNEASFISPAILCGHWGSGKSTHAKRIVACLNSEEYKESTTCIYLDAFKCDHSDDPYGMILSSLYHVANDGSKSKIVKFFKENKIPYAKSLGLTVLKSACALVPIAGEALKQIVEDVSNVQPSESLIIEELERSEKTEEKIQALKNLIKEIVCNKQLLFIIDELDRCRPDFSVDLLEKIKHIFDCEGIKFLLVMNKEQLLASVKHRYGLNETMSKVYLDKFIRHEFTMNAILQTQVNSVSSDTSYDYFYKLIEENKLNHLIKQHQNINMMVKEFIRVKNMQLREVERFVKNIALLKNKAKEMHQKYFEDNKYDESFYAHSESLLFAAFVNAFCPKTRDGLLCSEYNSSLWIADIAISGKAEEGIPRNCHSAIHALPSSSKLKSNAIHYALKLSYKKDAHTCSSHVNGRIYNEVIACALQDIYLYLCHLNCVPYQGSANINLENNKVEVVTENEQRAKVKN